MTFFKCTGVRSWFELDIICSSCEHTFKVEYSATEELAMEQNGKNFFLNGGYKMCPSCRKLGLGQPWGKLDGGIFSKYDLGFQSYGCDGDSYNLFDDAGNQIDRVKR